MIGRDPGNMNARDKFTLTAIRQVLLDVMWARDEPDTVASNWSRSKSDFDMAVNNLSLNYRTILPVLGNLMAEDRVGLGMALTMVLVLLRPGKNAANVQFNMICKTQTWYTNAYDVRENFSCETVMELDQRKQYFLTSHTFKLFASFMWSAHLRMGMVWRQNKAVQVLSSPLCKGREGRQVFGSRRGVSYFVPSSMYLMSSELHIPSSKTTTLRPRHRVLGAWGHCNPMQGWGGLVSLVRRLYRLGPDRSPQVGVMQLLSREPNCASCRVMIVFVRTGEAAKEQETQRGVCL